MSVEYTWTFGPMKVETVDGINNVVTGIQWCCIAKDSAVNDTVTGMESGMLQAPLIDPNDYVPLDQLTDIVVNAWIDTGINKSEIEAKVLELLNSQLTPPMIFVDVPAGINSTVDSTASSQVIPENPLN